MRLRLGVVISAFLLAFIAFLFFLFRPPAVLGTAYADFLMYQKEQELARLAYSFESRTSHYPHSFADFGQTGQVQIPGVGTKQLVYTYLVETNTFEMSGPSADGGQVICQANPRAYQHGKPLPEFPCLYGFQKK